MTVAGCGGGGGGGGEDHVRTEFTVSGTIEAVSGTAIDGDTNDPFSPLTTNDSDPQDLTANPLVLGGFVTATPTNTANDRFADRADAIDRYREVLSEGQVITLTTSDFDAEAPSVNNLNLELIGQSQGNSNVMLMTSATDSRSESITVPADGEYRLTVNAQSGSSNYQLTVAQADTTAARTAVGSMRMAGEFVPGEMIVRFKGGAVGSLTSHQHAAAVGLTMTGGGAGRAVLLDMGNAAQRAQAMQVNGVDPPEPALAARMTGRQRLKYDTMRMVQAVQGRADVASADLNYIARTARTPNDPNFGKQWHYPLINLPAAWNVTVGDPAVIVSVVDTGVLIDHPDLQPNLTSTGYDFISDADRALDGDGIDSNPDDPGDQANTPVRSSFHGTHVAGTVAAAGNNNRGVAGVSWQTSLMPVRVLGRDGAGTLMDIIQGMRYAAGLSNDSGVRPPRAADIINLSLGAPNVCPGILQAAVNDVRARNVVVVAAAGNQSSNQPDFPTSCDGVVGVSAVDRPSGPDDAPALAPYSNFGADIDVAAPGGNQLTGTEDGVLSTLADDTSGTREPVYGFLQGTSMASPHMAGVVSLMKAVDPALTPAELDNLIRGGMITRNGDGSRNADFGFGLIDALAAVREANALANGGQLPPILTLEPAELDFGNVQGFEPSLGIEARDSGGRPFRITGVSDNQPWLSVTPEADCPDDGLCTYTATVNGNSPELSTERVYSAAITFETDIDDQGGSPNTQTVQVAARIGAAQGSGNTGFQFVLLIPEGQLGDEPGTQFPTVGVANDNGSYAYRFTDVEPGRYRVLAGSDSDNDISICDAGESCGGFPTVDQLGVIEVTDDDVTGIDFTSNFGGGVNPATNSISSQSKPAAQQGVKRARLREAR